MKNEPKRKKEILCSFLEEGILPVEALNILSTNDKYKEKLLTRLTEEGCLKNKSMTVKTKNRQYTVRYKVLTQKGLQWIVDNCQEEYPWLIYIENPIPKFSVMYNENGRSYSRYLKSLTMSLFLKQLGIPSVQNREISGNKKTVYYKDIVNRAINKYNFMERHNNRNYTEPSVEDNNYYHIKNIGSDFKLTEQEIQQNKYTQCIGLLIYDLHSFLVYSSLPKGLKIVSRSATKTKDSVSLFYSNKIGIAPADEWFNKSIIIAKNRREWKQTFQKNISDATDTYGKLIKNNISKIFTHSYLLPLERKSVYLLSFILKFGESYVRTMIDQLIERDDKFRLNIDLYYENCEAVIGIPMDLTELFPFYHKTIENPEKEFVIVCQEWQEEYYREVFPENVSYYNINIPDTILQKNN